MTPSEWSNIADRISALWPPALNPAALGAYYEVLDRLDRADVLAAVRAIASTSREKRPPAGLILETALRISEARPPALPPAEKLDQIPTGEHQVVVAMLARKNTPEQLRRAQLLKPLIGRVTLAEMWSLMRLPTAQAFDAAIASHQPVAAVAELPIGDRNG